MNHIITELGTTFTGDAFWTYNEKVRIKFCYASVAHPRAHGQIERANTLVLDGLRARVEDSDTKKEVDG